nr:hypothetical protein CFP56_32144 [Quercus suber]
MLWCEGRSWANSLVRSAFRCEPACCCFGVFSRFDQNEFGDETEVRARRSGDKRTNRVPESQRRGGTIEKVQMPETSMDGCRLWPWRRLTDESWGMGSRRCKAAVGEWPAALVELGAALGSRTAGRRRSRQDVHSQATGKGCCRVKSYLRVGEISSGLLLAAMHWCSVRVDLAWDLSREFPADPPGGHLGGMDGQSREFGKAGERSQQSDTSVWCGLSLALEDVIRYLMYALTTVAKSKVKPNGSDDALLLPPAPGLGRGVSMTSLEVAGQESQRFCCRTSVQPPHLTYHDPHQRLPAITSHKPRLTAVRDTIHPQALRTHLSSAHCRHGYLSVCSPPPRKENSTRSLSLASVGGPHPHHMDVWTHGCRSPPSRLNVSSFAGLCSVTSPVAAMRHHSAPACPKPLLCAPTTGRALLDVAMRVHEKRSTCSPRACESTIIFRLNYTWTPLFSAASSLRIIITPYVPLLADPELPISRSRPAFTHSRRRVRRGVCWLIVGPKLFCYRDFEPSDDARTLIVREAWKASAIAMTRKRHGFRLMDELRRSESRPCCGATKAEMLHERILTEKCHV